MQSVLENPGGKWWLIEAGSGNFMCSLHLLKVLQVLAERQDLNTSILMFINIEYLIIYLKILFFTSNACGKSAKKVQMGNTCGFLDARSKFLV